MRLGQLARKLDTTTSEIVQYLADKDIDVKDHPNVKLDEENELDVIAHFGGVRTDSPPEEVTVEEKEQPELDDELESDLVNEESVAVEESPQEIPELDETSLESEVEPVEPETIEQTARENLEVVTRDADDEESMNQPAPKRSITVGELFKQKGETDADEDYEIDEQLLSQVDVIKAPKVELPGLKVVGKIELPQPPSKEEESETEEETEPLEENSNDPVEPKIIRHDRRNKRKRLTKEELEAKRLRNKKAKEKRLAKQVERRKLEEEQRLKNIKKQHYKEKISKPVSVANKKVKKKAKAKQLTSAQPKPKTVLGKFWRWLNT